MFWYIGPTNPKCFTVDDDPKQDEINNIYFSQLVS